MENEYRMNCRLCDKDITGKNGLLLYDFNDNIETRLGRKINTILSNAGQCEHLSNFCCECCSSKIEICFSLLLEIKASDEVIQQTYNNLSSQTHDEKFTQLFMCQECNTTISGIKLFIKHHENHILKKTIAGSKKDIPISAVTILSDQGDQGVKTKLHKVKDDSGSKFMDEDSCEFNGNSSVVNGTVGKSRRVTGGGDDTVESAKIDDSLSESNQSFDELNNSLENADDGHEVLSEIESDEENREVLKEIRDLDLLSEASDGGSEDSMSSESSFKNLLDVVKWELEKSDNEETDATARLEPNENGKYGCDVCNIAFDYKFLLALHLKENHNAYHEYDATHRENQLREQEEAAAAEDDEDDLQMKCHYCQQIFQTSEFKDHLAECREAYSSNAPTLCQICGKMCNARNLGKHMEEHKKLGGWTCDFCGKKFKAKRFLKSHLGEHDESKKKICEICGKKLLPLSFFSHITKHRKKRHVCQYCGKAFTYNYGLRIHLKVHDTNKKLESKPEKKRDKVFCWLCKKDFNCTIALNKHLKNDHNAEGVEQDSRFPCSQCDKKFADMFSLKAHLKLIHEMKDEDIARLKSLPVYRYIECNVCNKVFNSENKIRIHMKQDHGLKPFEMEILKKECEKCGKKFASKQNLIHHINGAHLHIKPMTCDICHEKFAKHSSLIYHKLRHSGEKPFQCEFCHKSYRQRNDVIRHLARHVRDKELTLEEASAVNNSPSRLVIKRRIFLKDSSINYRSIFKKNRRKSEVVEMEAILEEEVNDIQEEQMEFTEAGIPDMIYIEEVQVDETRPESPMNVVHGMNVRPVYNEERNTIILSNPDVVKNSVTNLNYKYIPSQLKHVPAVIVKKQEQI